LTFEFYFTNSNLPIHCGIGAMIIAPIPGLPRAFYALASLNRGLPGYLALLTFLPLFLSRLKHESLFGWRK